MSTTVDERIVEMRFDNKQFESNAQTSLTTLEKLKSALKFDNVSTALKSVTKSANELNFESINNAVDTVNSRFSLMGEMGVAALHRIVDKALNAGEAIVKSLTVDPIKTGLEEYETKMNAVQVIKANTMGKNTMEDITAALEELNTYADKTIYNFAQMTDNVGKFTAQGLSVEQATVAIKGLANLAAASGASAADMSRATYQMSQALSGVIRKIDWNSLRNANMATTTLKDTLIDLARVHGIAIDKMIEENGTFEDSLQEGWLTGEMFTEAMNIYSGVYDEAELKAMGFNETQIKGFQDLAKMAEEAATKVKTVTQLFDVMKESVQSQWTQTWEYIIGNFDEAGEVLTAISNKFNDIVGASGEARNKMLKEWHDLGGRKDLIEGFANIFGALEQIFGAVHDAFVEMFPPMQAKTLIELTKRFKEFSKTLKPSKAMLTGIHLVSKVLFAILKAGVTVLKVVVKIAGGIVLVLGKIIGLLFEGIGVVADFVKGFVDGIKESEAFAELMEGIGFTVQFLKDSFNSLLDNLRKLDDKLMSMPGVQKLLDTLSQIKEWISGKIISGIQKLSDAFSGAFGSGFALPKFEDMASAIDFAAGKLSDFINWCDAQLTWLGGIFGDVWDKAKSFFNGLGIDVTWANTLDLVAAGFNAVKNALVGIKNDAGDVLDTIKQFFTNIFGDPAEIKEKLSGTAKVIGEAIQSLMSYIDIDKLTKIAGAAAGIYAIYLIVDALKRLHDGIKSIGEIPKNVNGILVEVKDTLRAYQMQIRAKTIWTIAKSVALLSASIFALSFVKPDSLTQIVSYLIILMLILNLLVKTINSGKKVSEGPKVMDKLKDGVTAFVDNVKETLAKMGKMIGIAAVIIAVGVAITLIAKTVMSLAKYEGKLGRGIGAVALIALILTLMVSALAIVSSKLEVGSIKKGKSNVEGMALTIIAMAAAIAILAKVAQGMEKVSWGSMAKAGVLMAGGLTIMIVALVQLGKKGKNLKQSTVALGAMTFIFGKLALIVSRVKTIEWETMGKAGALMLGAFTIMGAALIIIGKFGTQMNETVKAMTMMTVVFAAISYVVKQMEGVKLETVGVALLSFAGVMVVIGATIIIMGNFSTALLSFATAIQVAGIGLLAGGLGILAFGAAVMLLATYLAPLGQALVDFSNTIIQNGGTISEAIKIVVVAVIDAIISTIPNITTGLFLVLASIISTLLKQLPIITSALGYMLLDILNWLVQAAHVISDLLFRLLIGVIDGLAQTIYDNGEALMTAIRNLNNAILSLIFEWIRSIAHTVIQWLDGIFGKFPETHEKLMGYLDSIDSDVDNFKRAFAPEEIKMATADYGNALLDGFDGLGGNVESIFGGVTGAINDGTPQITAGMQHMNEQLANVAGDDVVSKAGDGASDVMGAVAGAIEGGIPGISDASGEAALQIPAAFEEYGMDGMGDITQMMKEAGIENLTDVSGFEGAANADMSGFLSSFSGKGDEAVKTCKNIGQKSTDAMKDTKGAQTAGRSNVTYYGGGIRNNGSVATNAASAVGKSSAVAMNKSGESYKSGRYIDEGLAQGIDDYAYKATNAARRMAQDVTNVINSVPQVSSPAKVTIKTGRYIAEGLMLGMLKFKDKTVNAAKELSSGTVDGINDAMSYVNDLVNGNLDLDPTIRPVLDTSGIQNGLGSIDDMMNAQRRFAAGLSFHSSSDIPLEEKINNAVDRALRNIFAVAEEAEARRPLTINVPLSIDKRQLARATATVTREELDRIDYLNNRKAGIA